MLARESRKIVGIAECAILMQRFLCKIRTSAGLSKEGTVQILSTVATEEVFNLPAGGANANDPSRIALGDAENCSASVAASFLAAAFRFKCCISLLFAVISATAGNSPIMQELAVPEFIPALSWNPP